MSNNFESLADLDKEILEKEQQLLFREDETRRKAKEIMDKIDLSLKMSKAALESDVNFRGREVVESENAKEIESETKELVDSATEKEAKLKSKATDQTMKLMSARLKTLTLQLTSAMERSKKAEINNGELEGRLRTVVDDNVRLTKANSNLQISVERLKAELSSLQIKYDQSNVKTQQLEKDVDMVAKHRKKEDSIRQSLESKIQRLNEDNQKLKDTLGNQKKAFEQSERMIREELQASRLEEKQAEKQNGQYRNIIKKQNQLVDILKKQKAHLEAAKLLDITENEFVKCIRK